MWVQSTASFTFRDQLGPFRCPSSVPSFARLTSSCVSGTSSIRVKNPDQAADQLARLEFVSTPLLSYFSRCSFARILYLDRPLHVYSCRMDRVYETMIKHARARRRVSSQSGLRWLEVADSMMLTFLREGRCFSRLAYLKRNLYRPAVLLTIWRVT